MFKVALLFKFPSTNVVVFPLRIISPVFVSVLLFGVNVHLHSFWKKMQVNPNYNGSSCDTINSQTVNQQGSLGVSFTSTIGNKCNGGKSLGLIIGLSVGIPCGVILVTLIAIAIAKQRKKKKLKDLTQAFKEHDRVQHNNFEDNHTFKADPTRWTENQAIEMETK